MTAAIFKAGLIDRHAFVDQRLIDLDGGIKTFAGFVIGDGDVTGKQLRHTGRVKINHKFFQLDRERQILNQYTFTCRHDSGVAGTPFGYQGIAAEGRVVQSESVLGRDIGNDAVAEKGLQIE